MRRLSNVLVAKRIAPKISVTSTSVHYTYIYIYWNIYIYTYIYVEPFFISRTADRVVFLRGRLVGSNHLDFAVKFAHPQNCWNYFAHICHTLPKKS